jgi:uncharacterized protein (TIGR02118 family)
VRRYVQSHTLLSAYEQGDPTFDGIAEVWADDTGALRAMTQSPVHPELVADEARFIDRASMGVIITEDHVIKEGAAATPETAVKRVVFLVRKAGLPVEEFQRYWLSVHGPIAAEIPALRRYVQSHTRRAAYEAGRAPAYDGAAIAWYDSADAFRAAAAGAEYARAAADGPSFLAVDRVRSILTREHVIVA